MKNNIWEKITTYLENNAFRLLSDTYDSIFLYDSNEKTLSNFQLTSPYRWPVNDDLPLSTLLEDQYIHPQDQDELKKLLNETIKTNQKKKGSFRILLASKYFWHEITFINLYDEINEEIILVLLRNNDKQKRELLELKLRVELDSLTGLYNRGTFEQLVKERLINRKGQKQGIVLLDIDNFREANNCYGHLFGDIILIEFAQRLQTIFSENAIIGRLGGDEFLIFLEDITSTDALIKQIEKLTIIMKRKFSKNKDEFQITTCIGVALVPEGGKTFNELYQNADLALYESKKRGINSYLFYNPKDKNSYNFTYENKGKNIKQNINRFEMSSFFKQMFSRNLDVKTAILSTLKQLTTKYHFSRSYIIEIKKLDRHCQLTYAWTKKGFPSYTFNTEDFPYEDIYHQAKFEDGVFYLKNISDVDSDFTYLYQNQGIKSLLHIAFWDGKEISGFIGFDNCENDELITYEEIEQLKLVVQVLALFIEQINKVKKIYQIAS